MEVRQLGKRYLDIGYLGDVKIYDPQVIVIVIVIVVTIAGVPADTPTMNNGKIGGLTIDLGM